MSSQLATEVGAKCQSDYSLRDAPIPTAISTDKHDLIAAKTRLTRSASVHIYSKNKINMKTEKGRREVGSGSGPCLKGGDFISILYFFPPLTLCMLGSGTKRFCYYGDI